MFLKVTKTNTNEKVQEHALVTDAKQVKSRSRTKKKEEHTTIQVKLQFMLRRVAYLSVPKNVENCTIELEALLCSTNRDIHQVSFIFTMVI